MRESWRRHPVTVGSSGGGAFFYQVIIKSMIHTHEKRTFLPFLHGKNVGFT
jgi:hypothetical protein